jgi:hypothetical protein
VVPCGAFDGLGMLQQNKGCSSLCGPVAQLGARFHGMEEVIGSIPIRSTNQTNNLADSQKRRDTLSIRWFSCCTLRGFPRSIQKNVDHPTLGLPLGWRQSLCINVHRRRDVGVAHQLLHHFDVFSIGFEQRRVRVTEGMEADPFHNPGPLRSRLEESVQQRICPRRHSALNSFAGEDPVIQCGIAGLALPS